VAPEVSVTVPAIDPKVDCAFKDKQHVEMKNPTDRIPPHNLREIIISSTSWNVLNAPEATLEDSSRTTQLTANL
jgi:hypothetical protein